MFTIKNMVHDVKQVPTSWIFEHFCKLDEKLNGHDIKIKSLFNSAERTPSMCIYYDSSKDSYRYKDFSSGKGGSALDLVKDITGLDYHKSCRLVVENYNDYVLHNNGGYDVQKFKQASKYKVSEFVFRSWNTQDQYFWTQFNIGSKLLSEYGVKPLQQYTMHKDCEDGPIDLTITGNYIYGYFTQDGTLYKIYQPKTLDKKFIKVQDYIQGSEQIKNAPYLVITSSLKDVMSLKSLKIKTLDIIAPDSENTVIRKELMEKYISKYKKVIVLFDYDEPGIKAMERYKELYPEVEYAILPMSKDPSDSIKDRGPKEVYIRLVPILNKRIINDEEESS
jgi:5S rRNA maturation endonuclease (ribonuclease M5)